MPREVASDVEQLPPGTQAPKKRSRIRKFHFYFPLINSDFSSETRSTHRDPQPGPDDVEMVEEASDVPESVRSSARHSVENLVPCPLSLFLIISNSSSYFRLLMLCLSIFPILMTLLVLLKSRASLSLPMIWYVCSSLCSTFLTNSFLQPLSRVIVKKEKGTLLTQSDIDAFWTRSYLSFHLGAPGSSAPTKVKPASTAGRAPIVVVTPASSLRRSHSSKSVQDLGKRVLRSGQKSKAAGKAKAPTSDAGDSSDSSVEVISAPLDSLGPNVNCVPVNPAKEAIRLASGRPRAHQQKSSKKAVEATSPALDAVTADVLEMLPKPRQLVRLYFLS